MKAHALGVQLSDLTQHKKIELTNISGKAIAIDAYNTLYQFLSRIRGVNGTPLKDRSGRITSHLSGLLYRTSNLVEAGIKPVFVFDGIPPILKEMEIKRRKHAKKVALAKYKKALKEGKKEDAKKYAQATSQLEKYMVEGAKHLLTLMSIPWIQAPSEGEAQAAHMTIKNDVWATASQDYDALLFGTPKLIRNLSITGRRKLPRKKVYVEVRPELIELDQVLTKLNITRQQLIAIAILIGTDFNPDGIKGIGPKKALQLVKKHSNLQNIIANLEQVKFQTDPKIIEQIFLKPKVTNDYRLNWKKPDIDGVLDFLCDEHDFSRNRVQKALEKMTIGYTEVEKKTTLEKWFT